MSSGSEPAPPQVALSFTVELQHFPRGRSIVSAARDAVRRVGAAIHQPDDARAEDSSSLATDVNELQGADVGVYLVGLRADTVDPNQSVISLGGVEGALATAAEIGLPRLVFLIDNRTDEPSAPVDEYRYLVDALDRRIRASGVDVRTVSTPAELEAALVQALSRLPSDVVGRRAPHADDRSGPSAALEYIAPAPIRRPPPRAASVPVDVDTLAALLSPASRVEPELLRAVRLECLPELPVDAEQELWFSPLVDARSDGGITFAAEEVRELRARLRALYEGEGRALVERAREVLDEVHAGISPLLRLEEELAWHEVVSDAAGAVAAAELAVRAVAARRDGAVHWVARVWSTLPESVHATPTGWVLGQVAGVRTGLPESPGRLADHHERAIAAVDRTVRLGLARSGGVLRLGVALDQAQATIDLPDTSPRVLEVSQSTNLIMGDTIDVMERRVLVADGDVVEVPVDDRLVELRTLAGDVYVVGDAQRELLDSVLLGPDGTWCVTRVTDQAAVLATTDDLARVLAAVRPERAPIDIARSLGRTTSEEAGHVLALTFDGRRASVGRRDGAAALRVRGRGAVEAGTVVRTLAHGPAGVEPVTLRATEQFSSVLVALDALGFDLVPGAPVVDDGDLLFGVVAPPSWSTRPAAIRSDLLTWALDALTAGDTTTSRELLIVTGGTGYIDALAATPAATFRVPRSVASGAGRRAEAAWVIDRGTGGSASLVARLSSVEIAGNPFRRTVRATRREDVSGLPPNDATGLLHALRADAGTVRLLDEDEARFVAAFVAGLDRSDTGSPRPAVVGGGGLPAARVGDPTAHPGVVGPPGVPTVLIGGMPAAVVGTPHICSFPPPAVHPPSVIMPPGSVTVLIGGMPAARLGDVAGCGAPIVIGAPTVVIGG